MLFVGGYKTGASGPSDNADINEWYKSGFFNVFKIMIPKLLHEVLYINLLTIAIFAVVPERIRKKSKNKIFKLS